MSTRAYIGLGSNLDAPAEQLRSALQALDQVEATRLVAASALYTSDSLLPGQPRYTNAVAALDTALPPLALLDALQAIENDQAACARNAGARAHWTWTSCCSATRCSMSRA